MSDILERLKRGHQSSGCGPLDCLDAYREIDRLRADVQIRTAGDAMSSIDHLQQRGRYYDIIQQAIADYDEWMLDDDYDAITKLHAIMGQMRARLALVDALDAASDAPIGAGSP